MKRLSVKKFVPKDYPLSDYPKVKAKSVRFPQELSIAFAVCSKKCGALQFIVDGSTQVCEYCGGLMFRTEVCEYVLAPAKRGVRSKPARSPRESRGYWREI